MDLRVDPGLELNSVFRPCSLLKIPKHTVENASLRKNCNISLIFH